MRFLPALALSAAVLAATALVACEDRPAKVAAPSPAKEEPVLPDAIPPSDAVGQPPPVILAPFNLPAYASIRPGATIEIAQSSAPGGGSGGLVTFRTRDAPRDVADSYRRGLESEFGAVSDAENARIRMLTAARAGTAERVEITVAPAPEGGSRVTISYVLPW